MAGSNFDSVLQHLIFGASAAADQGSHTIPNNLYDFQQICACEFMIHKGCTRHTRALWFRSWRRYRYILSRSITSIIKPNSDSKIIEYEATGSSGSEAGESDREGCSH
jgi:hypothetical protein